MIKDINKLIDINLRLVCEHISQFFIYDFKNLEGESIGMKTECEIFADELAERGLIKRTNELCTVKDFGVEVHKSGGWLKHLSDKEESRKLLIIEQKKSDNLDREIKILQKDNLEHQKKIRSQKDRIRDLTEELKILSLLRAYWWFIGICIGIGIFLRELLELIKGS